MRYLCIALAFLLHATAARADGLDAVRPIDEVAAATLQRALERSAVVRSQIRELGTTHVIAHLELSRHLPTGIAGATRFVASRGQYRFVRITLSSTLSFDARVAMLAHELQHALEIAHSRAHDLPALNRLMESRGYRINGKYFETSAALRVERDVRQELRNSVSEAEPVVELDHQHLGAAGAESSAKIPKR